MQVPRVQLALSGWQLAAFLQGSPVRRPPLRAWRRRLGCVECGLQVLGVCRAKCRDSLEAVRGERAAEPHAPIDGHARGAVGVPPEEALLPEVGLLHDAEAVCRFGVDAIPVGRCPAPLFGRLAVESRAANGPAAPQCLTRRQNCAALGVGDAGVTGVDASEAAVRGDARLPVLLESAVVSHPGPRLLDDASRLHAARDEGQVSDGGVSPALCDVRCHALLRCFELGEERVVVKGQDGLELTV